MFEEVPRTRRGLAAYLGVSQLTARRIVLGPFVIGGGVLLAAVGGSVAVAATMITASTIRANDVPPHPREPIVVPSSSAAGKAVPHSSSSHRTTAASVEPSDVRPAPPVRPSAVASRSVPSSSFTAPSAPSSAPTSVSASGTPTLSVPSSTPSPAGNAIVYVSAWDADTHRLVFEFATVSIGTGPQHSDVYSLASSTQYTATLADDLRVISGGKLCPPAGSTCTVEQLIAGAANGFFAELAIDPSSAVHQVTERDNVSQYAPTQPQPSPTSTSPSPTAQPTA